MNCSIALVYKIVDAGRLPAVRITDRAIRIDPADLAEYLVAQNQPRWNADTARGMREER